jgi:hypothetical protein
MSRIKNMNGRSTVTSIGSPGGIDAGILPTEPQICAVVDHPKLEHSWLWEIFGSKIRKGVTTEQMFDETEDLPPPPRQEISRPELVVDVPKEIEGLVDEGEFEVSEIEVAEPV